MKTRLAALVLVVAALALACIPVAADDTGPVVTIAFVGFEEGSTLTLEVGQSYTFTVHIESSEPFVLAAAQTDAFYPGRGVFWHGGDRTTHGTAADLELTVTAKNSTAKLGPVSDWPELGDEWPQGVAPLAIVAGVRFQGGLTIAKVLPFAVQVP